MNEAEEIAKRMGFSRKFVFSLDPVYDPVSIISLIASRYSRVLVIIPSNNIEMINKLRSRVLPNMEVLLSPDLEDTIEVWVADTDL